MERSEGEIVVAHAKLLQRFLLGMLSGEERDRIEREYISDEVKFEDLGVAENELVDSYVRGELSEEEQRHFRLHYLSSTDRRSKVDFARSLNEVAVLTSQRTMVESKPRWLYRFLSPAVPNRLPRFALASAGLGIAFITLTFVVIQNRELRLQLQRQETENAKLRENREALVRELTSAKNSTSQSGTSERPEELAEVEQPPLPETSVTLSPTILRGGTSAESVLPLPVRSRSVHLSLVLEEDQRASGSFVAEIHKVGVHEPLMTITGQGKSHAKSRSVVAIDVPAKAIHEGYYTVTLYALGPDSNRNEVGSYSFRAK